MPRTECNGCGGCCDPVVLPYTKRQVQAMLPDPTGQHGMLPANRQWIIDDLTQIPRREGKAMVREWSDSQTEMHHLHPMTGEVVSATILLSHFYSCRHFNAETRQCMNWENRPPMCSGYPWYDDKPDETKSLPTNCSFKADVKGVPVELRAKRSDVMRSTLQLPIG